MNTSTKTLAPNKHNVMKKRRLRIIRDAAARIRHIRFGFTLAFAFFAVVHASLAGSATWGLKPTSNDWNTAANWTPETVPDGPTDIATFDVSNVTDVAVPGDIYSYIELDSLVFSPGASAYDIIFQGGLFGTGVVNNSGIVQYVDSVIGADFGFNGNATAGDDVVYTNNGEAGAAYGTVFNNQADAGNATFINKGDSSGVGIAYMVFRDNTSAANSTIINESGDTEGARLDFQDNATAASSSITLEPGSILNFDNQATADNATLIAVGSTIIFQASSTGGLARMELTSGSVLNLFVHNPASVMSIGSLEGDSTSRIGLGNQHSNQQLTIGGNGLSTTFDGVITHGGSLVKVGSETLTLTGANTYSGGTTIAAGTLLAAAATGSATGTGPVQVNAGTFGGTGRVTGAVTVGTGNGPHAFLAPGVNGPGTLSIAGTLTFKSDGGYKCDLGLTPNPTADQVSANGVTIEQGARFMLRTKGNQTLPIGTMFTVINNTAQRPTRRTFANLPDGSTFTVGNNTFQVSYEGGDGNDLTLTVVQ
jgi:autotransporter-associated beta strand protein